jgi:Uma2 family endonuclease
MAGPAPKRMTLAEFLEWDDGTDTRYELVDGQVVAMAPPTRGHGTLAARLTIAIGTALRPPCEVITEAGIAPPERADTYYQADVVVTRTPQPSTVRGIADPILIVEVLSPSTADHDRGSKLAAYRRIDSVREILLVSSQERHVELWRRDAGGWRVVDLIGEAEIRLETVDATVPLAALYEDVLD